MAPDIDEHGPHLDVCRHDLGVPVAWARPHSTEEVEAIIRVARDHQVPVVTVGSRTAYWHPLHYQDALVLDLAEFRGVLDSNLEAGWVRFAAGTPVREADDWLRARGACLPAHMDGFGDTPIGGMVAVGMNAGMGMGMGNADTLVAGLTVVLGSGEVVSTGAAHALNSPPFVRGGLPDPTGFFLASEGALGVVTEVVVRAAPRVALASLSWETPASARAQSIQGAMALGKALRAPGLFETFRVEVVDAARGPEVCAHTLVLRSPLSMAELEGRVGWARGEIQRHFQTDAIAVMLEEPAGSPIIERWQGAPGDWEFMRDRAQLAGVDVLVPRNGIERAWEIVEGLTEQAAEIPFHSLRRALYLAPDYANIGMHFLFQEQGAVIRGSAADAFVQKAVARLAQEAIVPYRWGRHWGALSARLDPGYARLVASFKGVCDPDGLLNPGVSCFGG